MAFHTLSFLGWDDFVMISPCSASIGPLDSTCRIRGRLEEEDFEQVPQLATSLLIELKCLGSCK